MKSHVSDHQLIQQFIDGNHKSMDILMGKYKSKVFYYINQMVRNRMLAEDLTQDTFIKVIKSLRTGNYKEDGRFTPWLYRIAHNLTIDHFRRERNYKEISNIQGEIDLFNDAKLCEGFIEKSISNSQVFDDLKKLINHLPEEQKSIVIMRTQLDMSFKEIADFTGVSINTALGRMRYAILNLRKLMEEHNVNLVLQ